MRLLLFIPFYILVSLTSCKSKRASNAIDDKNAISIEVKNSFSEVYDIDTLISEYNIVQLETNRNSLIGTIDNVYLLEGKYIVIDKFNSKSVIIFDKTGKYINKLSAQGRGPGEFSKLSSCNVDKSHIYIFDSILSKILKYNSQGILVQEYKFPNYHKTGFSVYGNSNFIFYNIGEPTKDDMNYKITTWDSDKRNLTSYFLPFDSKLAQTTAFTDSRPFLNLDTSIVFNELFNDTIYSFDIGKMTLNKKYVIKFEERPTPENFINDYNIYNKSKEVGQKGYQTFLGGFIEKQKFLIFNYQDGLYTKSIIYNKTRKKIDVNTNSIVSKKLDIKLPTIFQGSLENSLVFSHDPTFLREWSQEVRKVQRPDTYNKNPLYSIASKLGELDNPILIIGNLK